MEFGMCFKIDYFVLPGGVFLLPRLKRSAQLLNCLSGSADDLGLHSRDSEVSRFENGASHELDTIHLLLDGVVMSIGRL